MLAVTITIVSRLLSYFTTIHSHHGKNRLKLIESCWLAKACIHIIPFRSRVWVISECEH